MVHSLQSPLFQGKAGLIHGFTHKPSDANETELARHFSISRDHVFSLKQIHSNKVYEYDPTEKQISQSIEGDGIVCNEKGIIIGVRTADCVPILVYDEKNRVVATIHAGWKGLIAGVIEKTLYELFYEFHCHDFNSLFVAIGPAICGKCFEVGPEVITAFQTKFGGAFKAIPGVQDRSFINLRLWCSKVLQDHKIIKENIDISPYCTVCNHDILYSFRKGDLDRRSFSFIGLK